MGKEIIILEKRYCHFGKAMLRFKIKTERGIRAMQPTDIDLNDLLSLDPKSGIIQLMGHRALLLDAGAIGLLRKDLINRLGLTAARNILTRFGYAHGWLAAENLSVMRPNLAKNPACGPAIHMLQGFVDVSEFRSSHMDDPHYHVTCVWDNSYEAEQHLLQFGVADQPVCWTLTGFVSGYSTRLSGHETYCIEHKCRAKGDSLCHIESRPKEGWGEIIDDHLPFFQEETIDGLLKDIAGKLRRSEKRLRKLRELLDSDIHPSGVIAVSRTMGQILGLAKRAAKVDSSVLIIGESGVGKEIVARFIHDESARAGRPFLAVNCGAITETLLESEFFGHIKGSFTGADRDRTGLFEAANGGTIFLDEIGELSLGMQTKLLRVLQEKEVRRIGENKSRPVNVKVIAATNRNLDDEIDARRFRRDLYYRLCVIEILMPTLRERTEDIMPLARFFLDKTSKKMGLCFEGFSSEAADCLLSYRWPGNVRELQNAIERAAAMCVGNVIQREDLPRMLQRDMLISNVREDIEPLEAIERKYILAVLEMTKGDKKLTAKKLNIGLTSLYRKLKDYNMA